MTLIPHGRLDEAFSELKRAMRLDPLSPVIHVTLSWAYYCARLYDKAVEQATKTLDLDATFPATWYALGVSSMLKGNTEAGIAAFQKGVEFSSEGSAYVTGLGWALARAGRMKDARAILDQVLRERAAGKYFMAAQISMIYAELQEKEEAISWLEKAYQERSAWMVYLKTDARYDLLRSDPRFQELMRRMRFPE